VGQILGTTQNITCSNQRCGKFLGIAVGNFTGSVYCSSRCVAETVMIDVWAAEESEKMTRERLEAEA